MSMGRREKNRYGFSFLCQKKSKRKIWIRGECDFCSNQVQPSEFSLITGSEILLRGIGALAEDGDAIPILVGLKGEPTVPAEADDAYRLL